MRRWVGRTKKGAACSALILRSAAAGRASRRMGDGHACERPMVRDASLRDAPHHEVFETRRGARRLATSTDLVLRWPAKPALEGRAAGTRASRPWFETRRCATLLTMRSVGGPRAPDSAAIDSRALGAGIDPGLDELAELLLR